MDEDLKKENKLVLKVEATSCGFIATVAKGGVFDRVDQDLLEKKLEEIIEIYYRAIKNMEESGKYEIG